MRAVLIASTVFIITITACVKQELMMVSAQLMLGSLVYADSNKQIQVLGKETPRRLTLGENGSMGNNQSQNNSSNFWQKFWQKSNEVHIREPDGRVYNVPVSQIAKELWEYAVLCENVYVKYQEKDNKRGLPTAEEMGWKFWDDFPSKNLINEAEKVGLYMQVWEKESPQKIIAVVFKGTQNLRDWKSNRRWFSFKRHISSSYKDQYTLVARQLGKEFVDELVKRNLCKNVSVVATGHSLGGGLAQQFAYALPEKPNIEVPRISHVYAFNPSPVTGWYDVSEELQTKNASSLQIDRIYEHGEIIAPFRCLIRCFHPFSISNVRLIRFNFTSWFRNHSMRILACALVNAAHRESKVQ